MTPAPGARPRARATGVGSLPGTDPREAAAEVIGELPDLPHLPELPGRGIGADMVGRTAALLRRPARRPAALRLAARRPARAWTSGGPAPTRPGPRRARGARPGLRRTGEAAGRPGRGRWPPRCALPRGEPVLSDTGALRDLVESLTEGLHRPRRRPAAAAAGRRAARAARRAVAAGGADRRGAVVLRLRAPSRPSARRSPRTCCATWSTRSSCPWSCTAARPARRSLLARRPGPRASRVDLTLVRDTMDDELGEAVEAGLALLAGLVPGPPSGDARVSEVGGYRRAGAAALATARARPAAAGRAGRRHADLRPGRRLTPAYARAATDQGPEAARVLPEDRRAEWLARSRKPGAARQAQSTAQHRHAELAERIDGHASATTCSTRRPSPTPSTTR